MSTQPDRGAATGEHARLLVELETIVWRLAELEPSDLATVPVALPVALAQYMLRQAQALDAPLPDVIVSHLSHGAWHTAAENDEWVQAQEVAAIIRRLSAPDVWQRFVQRHPQAREGL